MVKIAYNNSKLHEGLKNNYENPERIEYCITELKKKYPKDMFINYDTDKNIAIQLIKNVHSESYIDNLINFKPKDIVCKLCANKINNNFKTFNDIIDTKCNKCNNILKLDNIISYTSIDTYYTPYTFDIILNSTYNLKLLIDEIKNTNYGYALIRPPGHHCNNKSDGFCIINNIVVGAKYAQSIGYKKILILDYDFHHGDGTEELVKNMENIHLISIHGFGEMIYPKTGNKNGENIINIPLNITLDPESRKYIDDKYYLNIIKNKVLPYIKTINPDIIFVSNGLDGHKEDPLEGFNLTDNIYVDIAVELKKTNKPIVYVSEGGYNVKTIARVSDKIINILNNDFSKYIYDVNNIYCNKINLVDGKNGRIVSLNDLKENNFKEVLEYIFINMFNYNKIDKLKFLLNNKIKNFNDLKYTDINDYQIYRFLIE